MEDRAQWYQCEIHKMSNCHRTVASGHIQARECEPPAPKYQEKEEHREVDFIIHFNLLNDTFYTTFGSHAPAVISFFIPWPL